MMQQPSRSPARTNVAARKAGRPKHFGYDEMRDVWVYVETLAALTDMPIYMVCSSEKAKFSWYTANMRGFKGNVMPQHKVDGKTLLRQYNCAARFLREQSAPYRKLRKMDCISEQFGEISPVEEHWRRLRDEAVARSNKQSV